MTLLSVSSTAMAAGQETTTNADDLTISVDTRWAGGTDGGYFPVRVRLVNRGNPRDLTFRFSSIGGGAGALPVVSRTITAEQNATVHFTLAIPIVGSGMNFGTLSVDSGSRRYKEHERQVQLPDMRYSYGYGNGPSPSLLVVSNTPVDFAPFQTALQARSSGSSPGGGQSDCAFIPPTSLPETWIDYSGLDIVAIPLDLLTSLPSPTRTGLVNWVHTGGTLLVTGTPVAKREELARLLEFDKHSFADTKWNSANLSLRMKFALPQLDQYGNRVNPRMNPGDAQNAAPEENFAWPGTPDTFAGRELMLGRVYCFTENPFPGSAYDWGWFLRSAGDERVLWRDRHGVSPRASTAEFLEFLNPGVRGVPTYMFLFLITVFALAIGPVNYFLLAKQRRLYLLLVTVPLIAFVTSSTLLGYSMVAHGFSVKSRIRSLTMLDQTARTSVSTARLALYAGLAPSGGLKFSAETAVYPIWPTGMGFESGTVDWTDTQNLESGWLHSRTHTQFLTMSHQAARGRLDVQPPSNKQMQIANGHEYDIEALIVADDAGQLYHGTEIPAGASATLSKPDQAAIDSVKSLLLRNAPSRPEGIEDVGELDIFSEFRRRPFVYRGPMTETPASLTKGQMETILRELQKISVGGGLRRRSYLAILRENPGIETGLTSTQAQAGFHVIVGYY